MKINVLIFGFIFCLAQSLSAQNLVFPPKINLFKYSVSISQYSLYGLPNIRIWGWSKNGKVAYSIERWIEGRGGQKIDFIIFDLINDTIVFELKMDSYEQDDFTDESLYNLFKNNILNTMEMHNIIEQRTEYLQFPIRRNNMMYNSYIIDVEYKNGFEGFFDNIVVSKYTIQVEANNGKKIIGIFCPVNILTRWLYVCGYFLSPFENRILLVIAEEHWGFEGTELTYRFSGCHLGIGFN
jgi:hypothetical protein